MTYFEIQDLLIQQEARRNIKQKEAITDAIKAITEENAAAALDVLEKLLDWYRAGQPLKDKWEKEGIPCPDEALISALEFDCKDTELEAAANKLAAKQADLINQAKELQKAFNELEV